MPVIDTSWLVALFNKTDAHHGPATEQARGASGLLIPGPVLTEFLNLVAHRVSKLQGESAAQRETRAVLRSVLENKAFGVEPHYEADHVHDLFMAHPKLNYADAVAASMAQLLDQPLYSYDDDQYKAIGRRRRPT